MSRPIAVQSCEKEDTKNSKPLRASDGPKTMIDRATSASEGHKVFLTPGRGQEILAASSKIVELRGEVRDLKLRLRKEQDEKTRLESRCARGDVLMKILRDKVDVLKMQLKRKSSGAATSVPTASSKHDNEERTELKDRISMLTEQVLEAEAEKDILRDEKAAQEKLIRQLADDLNLALLERDRVQFDAGQFEQALEELRKLRKRVANAELERDLSDEKARELEEKNLEFVPVDTKELLHKLEEEIRERDCCISEWQHRVDELERTLRNVLTCNSDAALEVKYAEDDYSSHYDYLISTAQGVSPNPAPQSDDQEPLSPLTTASFLTTGGLEDEQTPCKTPMHEDKEEGDERRAPESWTEKKRREKQEEQDKCRLDPVYYQRGSVTKHTPSLPPSASKGILTPTHLREKKEGRVSIGFLVAHVYEVSPLPNSPVLSISPAPSVLIDPALLHSSSGLSSDDRRSSLPPLPPFTFISSSEESVAFPLLSAASLPSRPNPAVASAQVPPPVLLSSTPAPAPLAPVLKSAEKSKGGKGEGGDKVGRRKGRVSAPPTPVPSTPVPPKAKKGKKIGTILPTTPRSDKRECSASALCAVSTPSSAVKPRTPASPIRFGLYTPDKAAQKKFKSRSGPRNCPTRSTPINKGRRKATKVSDGQEQI